MAIFTQQQMLKWKGHLMMVWRPFGFVFMVSAFALVGCGDTNSGKPTARLQGAVTIGGERLPPDVEANLIFKPTAAGQASTDSARIADGRYAADQVPVGNVMVYFDIQQPTGKMISEAGGTPYPEYRNLLPRDYRMGVEIEVDGDDPNRDFKL